MKEILHVGLDVGSTTVKIVVMNNDSEILYENYQRHFSDTKNTVCKVLEELSEKYPNDEYTIALTGSGAMSAARFLDLPFIQEVVSCKRAVEKYIPQTDVVIELGGEDAKIIYFGKSIEQRMNGTCAGGTGAFIDRSITTKLPYPPSVHPALTIVPSATAFILAPYGADISIPLCV